MLHAAVDSVLANMVKKVRLLFIFNDFLDGAVVFVRWGQWPWDGLKQGFRGRRGCQSCIIDLDKLLLNIVHQLA